MGTISASQLVDIQPGVLGVGGTELDIIGMFLTQSTRIPLGTVQEFFDDDEVSDFFGPNSNEFSLAETYFEGFINSTVLPSSLKFSQYNSSAVAAYLRGGNISALPLSALQTYIGSLDIVMDGYPRNASSVNLSTATSFSSAAGIIQTALNAADPNEAMFTGAIGASFTASAGSPSTKLVVTAVTGLIFVGDTASGTGIPAGAKIISQDSGGTPGGAGTYNLSVANTASAASCTTASNVLVASVVASGTLSVGQNVQGSGFTDAIISALGTGTGGVGTYIVAGSPQHVVSESLTAEGAPVAVTYDSVSGAFIITSGFAGAGSSAAFATGGIAGSLLLTAATDAVLSQGAAAAVPAAFMNALVQADSDWVTFMTTFDPDNGSGNTVKQAFASWKNTQNNRFAYVCWDTDPTPALSVPAMSSLGYILANNNDSGTCLIWEPGGQQNIAAFVCGAAASINFAQKGGRISFAYKSSTGLSANVSDNATALNLGGNPQTANRGNGYNYYGAYGAANQNFIWFQRGLITGEFLWLDSYINQIWFNNGAQNDLLNFMGSVNAVPYDDVGKSLIEGALASRIAAGLNFGMFAPGTISPAQVTAVNAAAGADIAGTLQTQGYYLQVLDATSDVRAARGSPPCTFYYLDRGSVQAINLSSVAVN